MRLNSGSSESQCSSGSPQLKTLDMRSDAEVRGKALYPTCVTVVSYTCPISEFNLGHRILLAHLYNFIDAS